MNAPTAVGNARWVTLAQAAKILAQLISVTVLARLLHPGDYGLMAMAAVVTNFAYLFRDLGTGAAVIQKQEVAPALASALHWVNLGLGALCALAIAAAAPLAARAFAEPALAGLLPLLALAFPLSSLGVVRQALLERESAFRTVALVEVAAALGSVALALLLAWRGAGVYSLAAQALAMAAASALLLAACSGFRPLPPRRADWHGLTAIAGFSGRLSLFNVVLYASRNADGMIIGRLLGAVPLGIYSLASRVMLFPVQNLGHVLSRALYPLLSRGTREESAALYLRSVGFVAFLAAPAMTGLLVLREPFVQAVFGPRWQGVAGLLAWLAPVGFLQAVVSTTGTLLMARGRADLLLRLGLFGAVLQVGAFIAGSRWGIEGVAACSLVANLINAGPALHVSTRAAGIAPRALLAAIGLPLALSAAMALVLGALQALTAAQGHAPLANLLGLTLAGAATYGACCLALRGQRGHLRLLFRF